jgi:hypothetical protein
MPEKLTALPPITLPLQAADEFYIVRPSEGLTGSHSVTQANLFAGMPRALPALTTPTPSPAGPGLPMQQFDVPAGTLAKDGDYLKYVMAGKIAAVNSNKFVQPRIISGSNIQVISPYPPSLFVNNSIAQFGLTGAFGWRIWGEIVRTSISTLIFTGSLHFGFIGAFSDGGIFVDPGTGPVGGYWLSGVFTGTPFSMSMTDQFTLTGISTVDNAGDLIQNLTTVEVYNF